MVTPGVRVEAIEEGDQEFVCILLAVASHVVNSAPHHIQHVGGNQYAWTLLRSTDDAHIRGAHTGQECGGGGGGGAGRERDGGREDARVQQHQKLWTRNSDGIILKLK